MKVLVLLAAFFAAQTSQSPKCYLSGTVVDAQTGRPLSKVQVILERPRPGIPAGVAATDAKGVFAMEGIDPGTYLLKAQRNGYLDAYFGERRNGAGTPIGLEGGGELKGLDFRLSRFGVIAGAIRDSGGEPIAEATIAAMRITYSRDGSRTRALPVTGRTDDLGQFRIAGLRPGRYYVLGQPKSAPKDLPVRTPGEAPRLEFLLPVYYPGVRDTSSAVLIEVEAGSVVAGIDITVPQTAVFNVRGVAVSVSGPVVQQINLRLEQSGPPDQSGGVSYSTTARAGGAFEFRGVPPGTYRIVATTVGSDSGVGIAPVIVTAADVDGARVVIGSGVEVTGHFTVEGQPKPDPATLILTSTHLDSGVRQPVQLGDGVLRAHLLPGRNRLHLLTGAGGVYLKSARSGGRDVLLDDLDVPLSGTVPLEVVIGSGTGTVEGVVSGPDNRAGVGAIVVLAPQLRSRTERFQTTTADQRGRFIMESVTPGDYMLFAWDDLEENTWFAPEFLKEHQAKGEAVAVRENGRTSVMPRVIQQRR